MSYLSVARTVVNFENELETLEYIHEALQYIKTNQKDKYSFSFKNQDFNYNSELIDLLINIITKMKNKIP